MAAAEQWRGLEPDLDEVIRRYPDVPPLVIIKTDVQRRGVDFTRAALDAVDPDRDATLYRGIYTEKQDRLPNGFILRDGTTIITDLVRGAPPEYNGCRTPYVIDIVDGKPALTDQGRFIEEVWFWPKPDYFDKTTSGGLPMWQALVARPQRVDINIYQNCDFWKEAGMGCKFCSIASTYHKHKEKKAEVLPYQDIVESVAEVLKQPGRLRMIQLCAGSILGGEELLDDEVNQYLDLLKLLGELFTGKKKILTQLIATAYSEKQLRRLYNETILTGYTADIEVLDERLFNYICPGKAKYIGYEGWKERLYRAAEIFGYGYVNTGIVSGVELAQPEGFAAEEEALEKCLAEAEELARHGVSVAQTIFRIAPDSYFRTQKAASLNYLVAFARELDAQQRKYHLDVYFDDYRTCGNHPNTDLARI